MGEGTPGTPLRDDADAGEITEEGLEVLVALSFSFFMHSVVCTLDSIYLQLEHSRDLAAKGQIYSHLTTCTLMWNFSHFL